MDYVIDLSAYTKTLCTKEARGYLVEWIDIYEKWPNSWRARGIFALSGPRIVKTTSLERETGIRKFETLPKTFKLLQFADCYCCLVSSVTWLENAGLFEPSPAVFSEVLAQHSAIGRMNDGGLKNDDIAELWREVIAQERDECHCRSIFPLKGADRIPRAVSSQQPHPTSLHSNDRVFTPLQPRIYSTIS